MIVTSFFVTALYCLNFRTFSLKDRFRTIILRRSSNGMLYNFGNMLQVSGTTSLSSTVFLMFLLLPSNAIKFSNEKRMSFDLHDFLSRSYNKNVIPRNDHETVNVNVSFFLLSILRFDEREETLTSSAWLSISWYDHFLKWNEFKQYETITKLFFNQNEIWKPDIMLINTVEHFKCLGSEDLILMVTSDGRVRWEPGHRFKTSCKVNINGYPFDTQQCSFTFSPWSHVDNVVALSSIDNNINLDHFEENCEWFITSTSTTFKTVQVLNHKDNYSLPQFICIISLQRRRMYYVLTVCLPIIILSVLNCMVYLLPPASGEKISFCLTILLAYMVYMSFLSDNLPSTSETTSYLVVYLSLMLCLSFLSVMNSVIVLLLWENSGRCGSENEELSDDNDVSDKEITTFISESGDENIMYHAQQIYNLKIIEGPEMLIITFSYNFFYLL